MKIFMGYCREKIVEENTRRRREFIKEEKKIWSRKKIFNSVY